MCKCHETSFNCLQGRLCPLSPDASPLWGGRLADLESKFHRTLFVAFVGGALFGLWWL